MHEAEITLSGLIWWKIRQWQRRNYFSNSELAALLEINIRTLSNYDKSPGSIKLGSIDHLISNSNIRLMDLKFGAYWNEKKDHWCFDWNDFEHFRGKEIPDFWNRTSKSGSFSIEEFLSKNDTVEKRIKE